MIKMFVEFNFLILIKFLFQQKQKIIKDFISDQSITNKMSGIDSKPQQSLEGQSRNVMYINDSDQFQNIEASRSQDINATSSFDDLNINSSQQEQKTKTIAQQMKEQQDKFIENQMPHKTQENAFPHDLNQVSVHDQSYHNSPQKQSEQKQKSQNNNDQPKIIQSKSQEKINDVKIKEITTIKIFEKKINDALEAKNRGNQFYKNNHYQEAIKMYTEGLQFLDPKDFTGAQMAEYQKLAEVSSALLFNLGSCYFNLNIWVNAEIFYSETITINPKYIKAIYKRALCRYELQKYEEAMDDIKIAFSLDKTNAEIHSSYEKILKQYNQKVKRDKQNMKQMSSKIFRTKSQTQLNSSQKVEEQKLIEQQNKQKNDLWSLVPFVAVAGAAAIYLGYKKWFSR